MKLECPYCKNDLIKGFIGNFHNGSLKWWHGENLKLFEKLTVFGGELLRETITGKSRCYRCQNCNKIIIDLDEE